MYSTAGALAANMARADAMYSSLTHVLRPRQGMVR